MGAHYLIFISLFKHVCCSFSFPFLCTVHILCPFSIGSFVFFQFICRSMFIPGTVKFCYMSLNIFSLTLIYLLTLLVMSFVI